MPIISPLFAKMDFPLVFHLEIDKLGNSLSVSIMGVISILAFDEGSALVKTRRGRVKVTGESLSVAVYENKTVEIFGKVGAVEFI